MSEKHDQIGSEKPRSWGKSTDHWETDGTPKPLGGIRILDFTWAWAGPHGTYLLAAMGAEVIKVESRKRPDHARMRSLAAGPSYRGMDEAPWFNDMNPNKLSISIDLQKPAGVEIIKRLAAHCDAITENFRPGVLKRRGLGYEVFKQIRPDIIMVSSSLNGTEGPESKYIGYAPNFSALGGLSGLTGRPGETPSAIGGRSDLLSGVYLAFGVVAALCYRKRTGKGVYLDMSSREAMACSAGEAFVEYAFTGRVPGREGNLDERMVPHNCYPCRGEDAWISIAVDSDEEWQALQAAMGNPEWSHTAPFQDRKARLAHREELDRRIGEWTRTWDREALVVHLQNAGIAAFGSLSNRDLWEDPHILNRGGWVRIKPPLMPERVMVGPPIRFSKSPARIEKPAPLMGEHNRYVLCKVLGLTDAQIDSLEREEVLV